MQDSFSRALDWTIIFDVDVTMNGTFAYTRQYEIVPILNWRFH